MVYCTCCGSSHLFVVCMSSSVRFVHVWIFTLIQTQRLFKQTYMVLWFIIHGVTGLILQCTVLWFWINLRVSGKKCWSSRFLIQKLQEILYKNLWVLPMCKGENSKRHLASFLSSFVCISNEPWIHLARTS